MNFLTNALIALSLFSLSNFALAGKDRGGGDSVNCNDGIASILSDKYNNPVLSDLFGSEEPDFFKSLDLGNDYYDFEGKIFKFLDHYRAEDAAKIRAKLTELKFQMVYEPLDILPDGVEISNWDALVNGCKNNQLGIQNFKTKTVQVYAFAYNFMSRFERVMFKIHEARMAIESTNEISYLEMEKRARSYVRTLFENPQFRAFVLPKKLVSPNAVSRVKYFRCEGFLKEYKSGETALINEQTLFKSIGFPIYGSDHQSVETMTETKHFRLIYDNRYLPGEEIHLAKKDESDESILNIRSALINADGLPNISVQYFSYFDELGDIEVRVTCRPAQKQK